MSASPRKPIIISIQIDSYRYYFYYYIELLYPCRFLNGGVRLESHLKRFLSYLLVRIVFIINENFIN